LKTIVFHPSAAKEFDALPFTSRQAVETALSRYAVSGVGDIKKLQGREAYRLRVGQYRVIFAEDRMTILAVYVGRRSTTTYKG